MPVIKRNMFEHDFNRSFLSCEKDMETIWRRLFVESRPYSDELKRLLIIDQPDCLDMDNRQYKEIVDSFDIKKMKELNYISNVPRLKLDDHDETRAFILLEFDDFIPTENPQYRDCTISFTIITHLDIWELEDYKLRPHQIAGFIDGIFNNCKLSGIGTLNFMGGAQVILDENWGGFILRYVATHGVDDREKTIINSPSV